MRDMLNYHGYQFSIFTCLTSASPGKIVIYDSYMTLHWAMHHRLAFKSIKSLRSVFFKPWLKTALSVCHGDLGMNPKSSGRGKSAWWDTRQGWSQLTLDSYKLDILFCGSSLQLNVETPGRHSMEQAPMWVFNPSEWTSLETTPDHDCWICRGKMWFFFKLVFHTTLRPWA